MKNATSPRSLIRWKVAHWAMGKTSCGLHALSFPIVTCRFDARMIKHMGIMGALFLEGKWRFVAY